MEPVDNQTFEQELTRLINKYSLENESNTPDFMLAHYLMGCLTTWNNLASQREKWSGHPATQVERK